MQTANLDIWLDTLPPKSIHTFSSVWSKTTLNICGVGGAGTVPQSEKREHFFS